MSTSGGARGLSLRRNVSWITLGRGLYSLSQWGLLAILAKLADAEAVGAFTLALAIAPTRSRRLDRAVLEEAPATLAR